jgi:hypothetical protein
VLSMLADDPAVEQVVFGQDGVLSTFPKEVCISRTAPSVPRSHESSRVSTGSGAKAT